MTMTINGSGTITGLVAGGLPDATVTQPDLAAGVAGTGPAFSAGLIGTQVLTSLTDTKIIFDTELFDTANCFNLATSRFTPNVAGYYQCNASSYSTASISMAYNYIQIRRNGSNLLTAVYGPYNGTANIGCTAGLVYLNGTTDYIEMYVQIAGSGDLNVGSGAQFTNFSASLVRSAT